MLAAAYFYLLLLILLTTPCWGRLYLLVDDVAEADVEYDADALPTYYSLPTYLLVDEVGEADVEYDAVVDGHPEQDPDELELAVALERRLGAESRARVES